MAWRGLHISRPATLTLKQHRVEIAQDEGTLAFALEDIAWIVLDTPQVMLSGPLIAACMEAGIVLVSADAKHMPCGIVLPFHQHFRQAAIGPLQIAASAPLKKRLWQRIVRSKLKNQSALLRAVDPGAAETLASMARRVQSGDPDNVEARAARVYWSKLWPAFARRDDEDRRNALLNYGYAVVRAAVARALVAHGLLPAFGLQHRSVANAFNLADDIVESYRPMVDALALERWQQALDKTELDLDDRRGMAAVLNRNVRMGEETVQILTAVEQSAASLVRAFETVTADELLMPRFPDATNAG